ncbi:hypothetical protein [Paenibacillus xylaniclasticus]|uniref:hypothetical protein n=1 Tax=Paenibacillus xylaniclasticus TaxID=588083 RepID=UPI000FDAB7EF|nr:MULTISPECIES: hypothetical protein [Paenibacillus]GFN34106.1 hypothetical protein PCURB6_43660 [Paenibacillus curdlanolyticus]
MKWLIISVVGLLMLLGIGYIFTGIYGYPWKHAELRQEAATYMKEKYNMDVSVRGSSYIPKFNQYRAEVYDVMDVSKQKRIFVEQSASYGDLEDNYGMVYWKSQVEDELKERYPTLYELSDIDQIDLDIPYYTASLEEGVSSIADERGIFIPEEPVLSYILNIHLTTADFSETLLQELLLMIQDLEQYERRIELFAACKEASNGANAAGTTKLLSIEYEQLHHIDTIDDLKKEMSVI